MIKKAAGGNRFRRAGVRCRGCGHRGGRHREESGRWHENSGGGDERTAPSTPIHFVKETSVDGFDKAEAGAKDGMHGVKEGSHVVVHYTVKGSEKTAREVDHIGEGGLKVMQGTAEKVDSGAKTIAVKTADGTVVATYKVTRPRRGGRRQRQSVKVRKRAQRTPRITPKKAARKLSTSSSAATTNSSPLQALVQKKREMPAWLVPSLLRPYEGTIPSVRFYLGCVI